MAATQEQIDRSLEACRTMLRLLGLEAEVAFGEAETDLVLEIKTPEPGRLIGRKGQNIDSMELLLNRMVRTHGSNFPRISLNVDGYDRKKKQRGSGDHAAAGGDRPAHSEDDEKIRRLAQDAAKEVKRWGEPKRLGPFNSAQRRLVHVTLREDPEIDTVSDEQEQRGKKTVTVRLASDGEADEE